MQCNTVAVGRHNTVYYSVDCSLQFALSPVHITSQFAFLSAFSTVRQSAVSSGCTAWCATVYVRLERPLCGGELVGVPQYVCFALLCFASQHAVHVRRVPVDARANGHDRLVR